MAETVRSVAIVMFDGVEVLDFAGPFEVFSVTAEMAGGAHFRLYLVAEEERPIRAVNGLRVLPDIAIASAPLPDVLIVPGGAGTRAEMDNPHLMSWVTEAARAAELVLSICSGARILARAGLLDGIPATTHHQVIEHVRELAPTAEVLPDERVVDAGRIVTTGGISAGIDGSFHVVQRLLGDDVASATARYMEYDWPRHGVALPHSAPCAVGSPECEVAVLGHGRREGFVATSAPITDKWVER